MDDTLDLVRSMRDSIRDFNCRAEQQNASIRSTFSGGFICPMPVGDDSQEGETECADPLDLLPPLGSLEETHHQDSGGCRTVR
jgi:hypothetical protein